MYKFNLTLFSYLVGLVGGYRNCFYHLQLIQLKMTIKTIKHKRMKNFTHKYLISLLLKAMPDVYYQNAN